MDYLRLLDFFFYGFTFLIIAITGIYFPSLHARHKKRKDDAIENISKEDIPEPILILYKEVVNRRYNSLVDWSTFQFVKRVFGFAGLMYSIFGLAANIAPEQCTYAITIAISVMAIVCVTTAIYLTTDTCIREHIIAWRRYDEVINSFNAKISQYKSLDTNGIVNKAKELAGVIKEVEDSLSSDEE